MPEATAPFQLLLNSAEMIQTLTGHTIPVTVHGEQAVQYCEDKL
jgi:hypothetical protein